METAWYMPDQAQNDARHVKFEQGLNGVQTDLCRVIGQKRVMTRANVQAEVFTKSN